MGCGGRELVQIGAESLLVGQEGAAFESPETLGTESLPTAQGKEGSWAELTSSFCEGRATVSCQSGAFGTTSVKGCAAS